MTLLTALFWMLRWTGGYRRTGRGSVEEVSGAASCKVLGGASLEDTGTVRGCPREARIVTLVPGFKPSSCLGLRKVLWC